MAEQKPPLIVEFNGEEYEFPAEATDAQISRFLKAIPVANAKDVPKAQTWATKFPNVAGVARGVLNTLPAAGALVGGVIAMPESVGLATVPGAALGAGAGRGLRDLIAEGIGLDEPTSALSKAGRIVLDTGEAGALQAVVPGAVETLKTPFKTLSELADVIPAKTAISKVLDLEKIAKQLRLVKTAAPILERPAWQAASAEAAPAAEAAAKMKISSVEHLFYLTLRKANLNDAEIKPIFEQFRNMTFPEQLKALERATSEIAIRKVR